MKEYISIGSVTGKLIIVGHQKYVVEAARNIRVVVGHPCRGKQITWPEEGARVAVHGLLTRNNEGDPTHMRPEEVVVLPSADVANAWADTAARLGQLAAGLGQRTKGGEQR